MANGSDHGWEGSRLAVSTSSNGPAADISELDTISPRRRSPRRSKVQSQMNGFRDIPDLETVSTDYTGTVTSRRDPHALPAGVEPATNLIRSDPAFEVPFSDGPSTQSNRGILRISTREFPKSDRSSRLYFQPPQQPTETLNLGQIAQPTVTEPKSGYARHQTAASISARRAPVSPEQVFSPTLSMKASAKTMRFKDYLELIEERRYLDRKLQHSKRRPWVNLVLLLTLVVMYIVSIVVNGGFAPISGAAILGASPETLIKVGGVYPPNVRANLSGKWWTLITANFLHAGLVHLLVNMVAIWAVCFRAERFWGHWRMALMLFVTGFTGALTCVMYRTTNLVTVGSSGMICGVIGVLIGDNLKNWRAMLKPHVHLLYWLINSVILLVIGIWPIFDNLMHTSSLIAGIFLALSLTPFYDERMPMWLKSVLFIAGVSFITVYWGVGLSIVASGQPSSCKACCYMLLAFNC